MQVKGGNQVDEDDEDTFRRKKTEDTQKKQMENMRSQVVEAYKQMQAKKKAERRGRTF